MTEKQTQTVLTESTITPRGRQVLVKRLPPDQVAKSGVVLPENQSEKSVWCRVLKIGNGEVVNGTRVPATQAKVGDLAIVQQYKGQKINLVEGDLLLVDGRDIKGSASAQLWPHEREANEQVERGDTSE